MVQGLAVIFLFQFLGEAIAEISGIPIPGNVIGMLLLFAALLIRVVPLETVDKPATILIATLGMFFIPPGVGLIEQWPILKRIWLPVAISSSLGTLITAVSAGFLLKMFTGIGRGKRDDHNN